MAKPFVLSVEDEPFMADLVRELLAWEFEVVSAHSVAEATAVLVDREPTLVLLDLRLPDGDGEELALRYRRAGGKAPIIVVSARDDAAAVAARIGAVALLTKPFELGVLEVLVERHFVLSGRKTA